MRSTPQSNTLFYGDNLVILREHIADESVDLIYLDPPFNSNANYNVLFKAPDGVPKDSDGVFEGARPDLPWIDGSVFKKARREKNQHQSDLGL